MYGEEPAHWYNHLSIKDSKKVDMEVRKLPRISNFGGMTIVIYYNDYEPPHFHIINNEFQTRIDIEKGTYMKESGPLPKAKEKEITEDLTLALWYNWSKFISWED